MRHRMPKNEQDQSYFFTQQSQDCEKTVVEPDLTNGLIRRMHDSDEEFDEDDVEDEDDDIPETPPAAHSQSIVTNPIKTEETRSLLKTTTKNMLKTHVDDIEKEAEDLSKKSTDKTKSITTSNLSLPAVNASSTPLTVNTSLPTQQHKIRSVSPPPLYNKAHHPQSAVTLTTTVLNKERDDFTLNSNTCLHGSHEHLNFTKHSYSNGLIPSLKLKRPRLSEDSNFNGSSTMDNSPPLVPEDDDYHYLLSLYPYMKQLSAAQKLRTRTKIQKLIFKELYKEDLEESK
ncbi:uncharacterized protein LOC119673269 [Teleopsis dalmanni]|uniref:uncharacterized protein LOC119673269 n=1 Tax=Teleopsis dalmanni TaxID=139649 RepID=UPI0018CF167A|nr:uncharacterized protein LOC119673269 [Teleopsis dalmanni]